MAVLVLGIVIVCLALIIKYSYQSGALQASSDLYTKLHIKPRGKEYIKSHSKLAMTLELDAKDARILKLITELQQTKHTKSILETTVNLSDNTKYRKCAVVVDKVIDCLTAYDSDKISAEDVLKLLRLDLTKVVDLKYTYSTKAIENIQELLDNMAEYEKYLNLMKKGA
jgi:hypothetical protein